MVTIAARDRVNCIAMYTCGEDGFNLSIVLHFSSIFITEQRMDDRWGREALNDKRWNTFLLQTLFAETGNCHEATKIYL